ncbi:MAG: hypothetical protein HWQ43_26770 [Nostoc sp. JL31]|uniref:hypothetical protein n=1 Tax=Nostoc sp. JL31 TaxID=2815395 RepID=UPI0025E8702B|nr:hypothetical protein [Nostoc sp. JL31]MBN3892582.1 hypothetical protein [Nostoc sp. JL31]
MPAVLTSLRISRLQENERLEDAPSAVLKHLGELKRPYLTADGCGGEAVGFD